MVRLPGRHTMMKYAVRRAVIAGSTTGEYMPTSLGSVRRRLLTPQLREVTFAKRGFPATPSATTERLEGIRRP